MRCSKSIFVFVNIQLPTLFLLALNECALRNVFHKSLISDILWSSRKIALFKPSSLEISFLKFIFRYASWNIAFFKYFWFHRIIFKYKFNFYFKCKMFCIIYSLRLNFQYSSLFQRNYFVEYLLIVQNIEFLINVWSGKLFSIPNFI